MTGTPAVSAELERLTEAQHQAALRGDTEALAARLDERQLLLDQLGTAAVSAECLATLAAIDAHTMDLLRARLHDLGSEAARLREGEKALRGYRVRFQPSPGFWDRVQ